METLPETAVELLRPGVFIELELPWLDHPFWFSRFTIRDEGQIETLKALGIARVRWNPAKSRTTPLPEGVLPSKASPPPSERERAELAAAIEAKRQEKRRQHEAVLTMRRILARCEREYEQSAAATRKALAAIERGHPDGARQARQVAADAAAKFTPQAQVVLQLIAEHAHDEGATGHALNVMVVAQMLAHRVGLPQQAIEAVGTAALLHDIGKSRIPTSVLYNTQRNRAEEQLYRLHPVYGEEMLTAVAELSPSIRQVVRWHHESVAGNGFPDSLKGTAVPLAAQIVGIANRFDNLCNPPPGRKRFAPAKAVAYLFKHERAAWREELFAAFVKLIGVYPPGSFVRLSNDAVGLVLRNNDREPLKPWVLLYEPDTPRSELVAVDLTTTAELAIVEAVPAEKLPAEVVETLDPRCKVRYFHDVVPPPR
ncbi:MAG: DUF3391 domain-containing protein [Hydrogenophilus sp.]|nr:DUF3391 domain-containing protein [Hydrogenophilus sp.]